MSEVTVNVTSADVKKHYDHIHQTEGASVLTSEQAAIEATHNAAKTIASLAEDRSIEAQLPVQQLKLLSSLGITAIAVPKQYGGLGASIATIVETVRIISAADGGIGQVLQLHNMMLRGVVRADSDFVREYFSKELLKGKLLGNALAETGGKHKLDLGTRVEKTANGRYLLNGKKFYSTGSYLSDYISVLAKDESGTPTTVLVSRHAPGVTVLDDWRSFGQRNTMSGTVLFENVDIDPRFLPPRRPPLRTSLTYAQILHAAIDTGIARGAFEAAARYLNTQSRAWLESGWEKPTQEHHIIKQFGEFAVAVRSAEAALKYAAQIFDQHDADPADNNLQTELILAVITARTASDHAALNITSELFSLLGASSALEKWNLDRFWRNARVHTTHDPIRWRLHHIGNYYLNGIEPGEYTSGVLK